MTGAPTPERLADLRGDLLRFAQGAEHPLGFGWLDDSGRLDPTRPVELWITCRMTHVMCLGLLADEAPVAGGPGAEDLRRLAAHGVRALSTSLRDPAYGGWFAAVDANGPVSDAKQAYGHAFVLLAASSAVAAGVPDARGLLDDAIAVDGARFWDEAEGLVVEEWDRTWSRIEDYRGINANMHTVEGYLAVGRRHR